jgi:hypothetical protein
MYDSRAEHRGSANSAVGLRTMSAFDPYPITYELSNP